MRILHLLRMSRWARNPPSAQRVKFVFALIAVLLAVAAVEHFGIWPDALTTNPLRP